MARAYPNEKMAELHGRTHVLRRQVRELMTARETWHSALAFAQDRVEEERYINRSPELIEDTEIDAAYWAGLVEETDAEIKRIVARIKDVENQ